MKAKIFLPLSLLLTLILVSCAFADISPETIKSDSRFAPFIERTRLEGAKLLPGRYIQAASTPTRYAVNDGSMMAPTYLILTIKELKSQYNNLPSYSATLDMYKKGIVNFVMTLEIREDVPVLTVYILTEKDLVKVGEDYIVASPLNDGYMFVESSVSNGLMRILFPMNDYDYSYADYEGSWIDDNASEDVKITFDSGKRFYLNDEFLGLYAVTQNRIALSFLSNKLGTIYTFYDKGIDSLIMSFEGGLEKLNGTAGIFKRIKN